MSVLVTGANGFLGQWVLKEFTLNQIGAVGWNGPKGPDNEIDLLKPDAVLDQMQVLRPEVILHLAGASSVAQSWQDPAATVAINVLGTLHLWHAAQKTDVARFIYVSSAEVYAAGENNGEPMDESRSCDPKSPYAISKYTAEQLLHQLTSRASMEVVILRPFNIVGPGQRAGFVLTDFAQEILTAKRENRERVLTGNLDVTRDFLDVRDAVRAYRLLCTQDYQPRVFNICSGLGRSLQEVMQHMLRLAGLPTVGIKRDTVKDRPNDRPVLIGDRSTLSQTLNWTPLIPWEQTLTDILTYEEQQQNL